MPRLKVFRAQMGFFDSVIAAPSQKAALEAWGARQDLFHEGFAAVSPWTSSARRWSASCGTWRPAPSGPRTPTPIGARRCRPRRTGRGAPAGAEPAGKGEPGRDAAGSK